MASVDIAQLCLRLPTGELIKGFSKFEDYAGSQAHRPCEFSLTLAGQKVQVSWFQDFTTLMIMNLMIVALQCATAMRDS